MAEAIYSTAMLKHFVCRIPKKRGAGYLKSVFGWHHTSDAAQEWDRIRPKEITTGDWCDLDGYLDIDLRLNRWEDGFEQGIEQIKESLSAVFPHITAWSNVTLGKALGAEED